MLPLDGALGESDGGAGVMDVVDSGAGAAGAGGVEAVRSAQLHRWYEAFRPWTIKYVCFVW